MVSSKEFSLSRPFSLLTGEHSVVYGTKAIAVSVGLNTNVIIHPINDMVKLNFNEVGIDAGKYIK